MVAGALAVRTIYRATRSIRIIVAGLSFIVAPDESQHVRRQLAQASLLLRRKFGKHGIAAHFDAIVCHHVLEHLDNVIAVMEEIHRLGRPGARVYIRTPHFSSWQFYTDPTHRHPFSSRSFDYFVPGTALFAYDYSPARFRKRRVALDPRPRDPLSNLLTALINRNLANPEDAVRFLKAPLTGLHEPALLPGVKAETLANPL